MTGVVSKMVFVSQMLTKAETVRLNSILIRFNSTLIRH